MFKRWCFFCGCSWLLTYCFSDQEINLLRTYEASNASQINLFKIWCFFCVWSWLLTYNFSYHEINLLLTYKSSNASQINYPKYQITNVWLRSIGAIKHLVSVRLVNWMNLKLPETQQTRYSEHTQYLQFNLFHWNSNSQPVSS